VGNENHGFVGVCFKELSIQFSFSQRAHKGLDYLSFRKFREQTLAVEMTREAYDN
jgi:hypothetical protein